MRHYTKEAELDQAYQWQDTAWISTARNALSAVRRRRLTSTCDPVLKARLVSTPQLLDSTVLSKPLVSSVQAAPPYTAARLALQDQTLMLRLERTKVMKQAAQEKRRAEVDKWRGQQQREALEKAKQQGGMGGAS